MDLIKTNIPLVDNKITSSTPSETIQRFSWISSGNGYALRGYQVNGKDIIYFDPNLEGDKFSSNEYRFPYFLLQSSNPFTAKVDWGDGTVEEYNSVKYTPKGISNGLQFVGSLTESRAMIYWRGNKTGTPQTTTYLPIGNLIENHKYPDNNRYNVVVEITGGIITRLDTNTMLERYPVFEFIGLNYLNFITWNAQEPLPLSSFTYLNGLTQFQIRKYTGIGLTRIPDSFWNLSNLRIIEFTQILQDDNSEELYDSLRNNLGKLKNLVNLYMKQGRVEPKIHPKFYPALNTLNKLANIFWPISFVDGMTPSEFYGEVTEIFPNRITVNTYFDCMLWGYLSGTLVTYAENNNSYFADYIKDIKGIEKVLNYNFIVCIPPSNTEWPDFPEWFDKCYSARAFINYYCGLDQVRMDSCIRALYKRVIQSPMASTYEDGNRNPYYGLNNQMDNRLQQVASGPSGTYQAPDGFEEGVSNGNPTTPGEMVYVMVHNYHQTWNFFNYPLETQTLGDEEEEHYCYLIHNELTDTYFIIFNLRSAYLPDCTVVKAFDDPLECKAYLDEHPYENTTGMSVIDDIIRNQYVSLSQ